MLGYKKGNKQRLCGQMPAHYPADRVYLDGDKTKTVQDALTPLNITGQVTFVDTPTNQTRFFKVGKTVQILFQGSSKTHSLQELLFTLPSDVRPTAETHLTFVVGSGAYGIVRIDSSGEARIVAISDATYQNRLYISASYCIA